MIVNVTFAIETDEGRAEVLQEIAAKGTFAVTGFRMNRESIEIPPTEDGFRQFKPGPAAIEIQLRAEGV